jgi:hypothetical protein
MPARLLLALLLAAPLPTLAQDGPRVAPAFADIVEDPATLIRLAESALGAGRMAEAADLLERAEARLLTRSEGAAEADRPAGGGAIGDLAAARDAIGRRDRSGAASLIASARARLDAGEAPLPAATAPAGPPKTLPPGAPLPLPAAKPPPLRQPRPRPAAQGARIFPVPRLCVRRTKKHTPARRPPA